MHYFVVAGILGCKRFACVLMVAEYLKKLPHVMVHRIFVKPDGWKDWLKSKTEKNGWNHFSLPIVWRELPFRGGKQRLIGGFSAFMEYCNEMYDVSIPLLESNARSKGLQMLLKEIRLEKALRHRYVLPRRVCVYGAASVLVPLFLPLLLSTPGLATCTGLILGLYDEDSSKREIIDGIVEEFGCIVPQNTCSEYFTVHVIHNIAAAVKSCDLLILVVPEFRNSHGEHKECWSSSVSYVMRAGSALAFAAKDVIRVVLISESQDTPICLCAAAFAEAAVPNVMSKNVVAVTAGIGIMVRSMLAYSLNVPFHHVEEVPVWGFAGVSHLLDPSLAPTPSENITYSKISDQFRSDEAFKNEFLQSYLWPLFGRRMENVEILLKRKPYWANVEALIAMLHTWYSEDSREKCIFLGIYSDGTFGIPPGTFFSQPAILTNGTWKPFEGHPLPKDRFCTVSDLCRTAVKLTNIYLNKDICQYILSGLDVELNYAYFLSRSCEPIKDLREHFDLTACKTFKIEELVNGALKNLSSYHSNEEFITEIMKELTHKALIELQHESLMPCLFSFDRNYDFLITFIKESMYRFLTEARLEVLMPIFFPSDKNTDFVKAVMKELISKTLSDLQLMELIPCLFHSDENTDFVKAMMKELICKTLSHMQLKELILCFFPSDENTDFVKTVMKELICKTLSHMQLKELIPCLLPSDANTAFVKVMMKELICKTLSHMQLKELIPCLFPSEEKVDFIKALMRELVCESLADLQWQILIPCLFPVGYNENFNGNNALLN